MVACVCLGGLSSYASADAPASLQDQAKGLLADDSLLFSTRNWYSKESGQRQTQFSINKGNGREAVRDRTAWSQNSMLKYTSGYTQGTVGFGLDLAVYNSIALERGKGTAGGGGNRILTDKHSNVVPEWSKLGVGDVRLRVSNTELKLGWQEISTPVLASVYTRALPSTYKGIALSSKEIEHFTFNAGTFTEVSPRTGDTARRLTASYTNLPIEGDSLSYLGVDWQPNTRDRYQAYYSRFDDIWDRSYLGAIKYLGDKPVHYKLAVDYYRTRDQGESLGGYLHNDTYSVAFSTLYGGHNVTLAWQQVIGDEFFAYVYDSNIQIANVFMSNFNGPNEKSLRLSYATDYAAYGIPGLSSMMWIAHGWDINGTEYKGGRGGISALSLTQHNERHGEIGLMGTYVVQSGPVKGASVNAGYAVHRATDREVDGNINEVRVITTFPFKIF